MNDARARLRFLREHWHLSPDALANRTGIDAGTIRRAELGDVAPDRLTVGKLSDALCVRPEWIHDGTGDMIGLSHTTVEEQHKQQGGPEQAGLPGYVIVGLGPWYTDGDGEWWVDLAGEV